MIEEIHSWLCSYERDYNAGVALLYKHCKNKILLKVFTRPQSKYNEEKLEHELEKLAGPLVNRITVRKEAAAEVMLPGKAQTFLEGPARPVSIDPDVLKASPFAMDAATLAELDKIEAEWRKLYKEAKDLHMDKLNDATPEKDRAAACIRIAEIREDLLPNHYWPLVKEIKKTGRLPEGYGHKKQHDDFDFGTTDPVKLLTKMKTLGTYVSKNKNNPAKAKDLEKWAAQISWIDNFLKERK